MTITTPAPVDPGAAAAERSKDASERGTTTIADRVVERLVAHTVTEFDGVGGSAARMLGVTFGAENLDRSAQARAHVTGQTAAVEVRLSVTYPSSVAETTEAARTYLTERTTTLTGLVVSRVDITVTALHSDTTPARRVR